MRNALRARIALSLLLTLLVSATTSSFALAHARFVSIPRVPHATRVMIRTHRSSARSHRVVQYSRSQRSVTSVSHRGRHHRRIVTASHTRHAYPLDFFMVLPPEFDRSPVSWEQSEAIRKAFDNGIAD